jgi:hypothetical protein
VQGSRPAKASSVQKNAKLANEFSVVATGNAFVLSVLLADSLKSSL